jgi:mitogen-activated protein kinase 15
MSEDIEAHILKYYDVGLKIGKGAYGVVWKCEDKKKKTVYALKKNFDAFQNTQDAQRIYREIILLQEFDHENIVKLNKVMKADNDRDIYMLFEYSETDLYAVLKANILEDVHKQFVIYQLLKSLKYMHSAGIIHRDLKPSNILINQDCTIKLADFGLARSIITEPGEPGPVLSDNVVSRWYRPPEILLNSKKYSKPLDIWSAGCIFGEMLLGKVLFPGDSPTNQLDRILQFTGRPTKEDISSMQVGGVEEIIKGIPEVEGKSIQEMFPNAAPEALDFLRGMLQFNPERRMTAEEALNHPYLYDFHNPDDEPDFGRLIKMPFNENKKFSVREYRDKLYEEISKKQKAAKNRILGGDPDKSLTNTSIVLDRK